MIVCDKNPITIIIPMTVIIPKPGNSNGRILSKNLIIEKITYRVTVIGTKKNNPWKKYLNNLFIKLKKAHIDPLFYSNLISKFLISIGIYGLKSDISTKSSVKPVGNEAPAEINPSSLKYAGAPKLMIWASKFSW